MKIIISHDVDHLYVWDHLKRDLIMEKLWIRSTWHLLKGKISLRTLFYRYAMPFHNRMNRIEELMEFDREHNIPSVFFFGMDNVLGMSYRRKQAFPEIRKVLEQGFDAGVHGVEYRDIGRIKKEHDDFAGLSGLEQFGIRNHYVRFDEETFEKQEQAGYLFDSTWFDKNMEEMKSPYKVGNMWEFPLHIMDGYICEEGRLEEGIRRTADTIEKVREAGIPYCTILFHDYQFDDRYSPQMKEWYAETVRYCEKKGYGFISYRDAVKELEGKAEKNAGNQ